MPELIGHFVTITSECKFCKDSGREFSMSTTGLSFYRALDIVQSHAEGLMHHHKTHHPSEFADLCGLDK